MKAFTITVQDPMGMHARWATAVSSVASKYNNCEIKVVMKKNNLEANAKSIMSLLSLPIRKSDKITFKASGSDKEQDALSSIKEVLLKHGVASQEELNL
ncbi:HPr family phosphocarrier protein [Mycoplasmopsis columbinasalis]|uniref:Phosphocarrier protein HPr n=1 Tax=Mycoplasmopsis columbinasalis TaxID=114880 RepID=A0A449B9T3_9BACT|nr:HPr family phosphocarrier protein [Mycoplasmopsis columbinasalis]VEU77939.1 phosphocarrier protein HPr [Mycoplasmopsis columbinasalis]